MSELPNVQQNNEQILNDIQSLQQMEQQLFNSVENNPNMTTEQQQKIIEKMNQISNMRISLYQTLSGVNNFFENALNTSIGSLKQQVIAIGIVENELNNAKKRLEILEQEKNNKIRLVEINTYYGDKYAEHSQLMKVVILTLLPVVILGLLNKKGILPSAVYNILIVIIAVIGGYFFWKRFASIITRDNMNYQEYNWSFDPNTATTSTSTTTTSDDPWESNVDYGTCIGDACCSNGLIFDSSTNVCVVSTSTTTESFISQPLTKELPDTYRKDTYKKDNVLNENFVNQILTKQQPGKYKIDTMLNNPEPFTPSQI